MQDVAAASKPTGTGHGNLGRRRHECLAAPAARRRQRDVSAAGRSDGWRRPCCCSTGGHWVAPRWRLPVALSAPRRRWSEFCTMRFAASSGCRPHDMPVVYRYVDWMIAVPLQVLALYFLVQTVASAPTGLFWRC